MFIACERSLDEVFGPENFVSEIVTKRAVEWGSLSDNVADFMLWYANQGAKSSTGHCLMRRSSKAAQASAIGRWSYPTAAGANDEG